jgi:hypothetical protein
LVGHGILLLILLYLKTELCPPNKTYLLRNTNPTNIIRQTTLSHTVQSAHNGGGRS